MYDYYEEERYYEPSQADEIFDETLERLKEVLNENIKNEVESLRNENIRLKQENEDLRTKAKNLDNRERGLERREKEFESKTEYDFYKKKFSEILKPLEEQLDMWYVDSVSQLVPKCNLCNDDRKVKYVSGTGKIIKGDCDCNKNHTIYKVKHTEIEYLSFSKSNSDMKFILTPEYDSQDYDDTYFKLSIQKLIKEFKIDEVSEYNYCGNYRSFTGFTTKEECEKYCNWLNSNTNKVNKPIKKSKSK